MSLLNRGCLVSGGARGSFPPVTSTLERALPPQFAAELVLSDNWTSSSPSSRAALTGRHLCVLLTSSNMEYSIRAASVEDCKDIARMILELAEYEKVSDKIKITQRDLEQDGFSKNPFFHGIIAEVPEQHKTKEGHTKIGYALYMFSYSSWTGRAIYMEDLYVMPEFRGKGIGKALMSKVAQLGLAAGCNQLNFTVLDWNKSSLDFYTSQGCFNVTAAMGYQCMRCEGEALEHLAQP